MKSRRTQTYMEPIGKLSDYFFQCYQKIVQFQYDLQVLIPLIPPSPPKKRPFSIILYTTENIINAKSGYLSETQCYSSAVFSAIQHIFKNLSNSFLLWLYSSAFFYNSKYCVTVSALVSTLSSFVFRNQIKKIYNRILNLKGASRSSVSLSSHLITQHNALHKLAHFFPSSTQAFLSFLDVSFLLFRSLFFLLGLVLFLLLLVNSFSRIHSSTQTHIFSSRLH